MKLPFILITTVLIASMSFSGKAYARGHDHTARRRVVIHNLPKTLDLTDAQRAQLKPLLQSERQIVRAIRVDPTLSPDEKNSRVQVLVQQTRIQVNQILTPDQQQKLDEIRQQTVTQSSMSN